VARRSTYAHRHRLDHPRRNRRWVSPCRFASGAGGGNELRRFLSRTGLPRQGNGVVGAEWLAARPHLKARAITQALRAREGPRGKRGRRKKRGWKHPPADAREDRTLEVVLARRRMSLQKSTADVLAQRNGSLHFNRFGGVRGRVPSSLSSRESVKAGSKETSVPDQRGSSHVTALEIGPTRV